VPNQTISFRVIESGCGAPGAVSAVTNAQGQASAQWTLGQSLGACHMEARAVDPATGAGIVFDTAVANVTAAAATTFNFDGSGAIPLPDLVPVGLSFPVGKTFAFKYYMTDRFGNRTTRIPGADEETVLTMREPTLITFDSIVHMRAAGARHGYAAGFGWIYLTGINVGTSPVDATAVLSQQIKPGPHVVVTITP
jgi:hypothetical protein